MGEERRVRAGRHEGARAAGVVEVGVRDDDVADGLRGEGARAEGLEEDRQGVRGVGLDEGELAGRGGPEVRRDEPGASGLGVEGEARVLEHE